MKERLEHALEHLAARWAPHAEDGYCAFNDLHAVMAFVGARRWGLAERVLEAQERRLARAAGVNYDMTRCVGLPASLTASAAAMRSATFCSSRGRRPSWRVAPLRSQEDRMQEKYRSSLPQLDGGLLLTNGGSSESPPCAPLRS